MLAFRATYPSFFCSSLTRTAKKTQTHLIFLHSFSDPTIKFFKDGEEEDYQGGRDYASLKKFVEDELEVKCNVNDPSECSEKERGYIEKMKVKTAEERASQLARLDGMTGGKMKAELRQWLGQRIRILKQLDEGEGGDGEF